MAEPVTITVYGTPAPQGSKRAFAVRGKGGVPTGRIAVIESSHDRVKSWRQAVIDAADAIRPAEPIRGPLTVAMVFYLARPKSHYRSGKNADLLKPDAPHYPAKMPDLSKLARATEDALTDVGMWADDAQVIAYTSLAKKYAGPDRAPGAFIGICPLETT
jgi:Holliday junction resolvase RusA-like endonuclease